MLDRLLTRYSFLRAALCEHDGSDPREFEKCVLVWGAAYVAAGCAGVVLDLVGA